MGAYSCLSERVDCYNVNQIVIGDQAVVSQDVFLCTASHDVTSPIMELTTAPIRIEPQAWICARAIILPGVTVGEGAVVAAGSVVTRPVDSWQIIGGNPAKFIRKRIMKP